MNNVTKKFLERNDYSFFCFTLALPVFRGAILPTFLPGGVVLPTDD
jgi:hypothetical protein